MAGRIATLLTRFSSCYSITRSIWQSFRFACMIGRHGKNTVTITKNKIWLRKNKIDQEVFLASFFHGYHRSPFNLGQSPTIVDFGSNIGLTILDFKLQYPNATIFGAEPDKDNFEICLHNIKGLSNCKVLQTAIWKSDGMVNYGGKDEQSYNVGNEMSPQKGSAKSMTIDYFIFKNKIDRIDYLKMDIEGAEYSVLLECKEKLWLQKTKYISVEIHDAPGIKKEKGLEELKKELESNNFLVVKSSVHWSSIFAINKSLLSV